MDTIGGHRARGGRLKGPWTHRQGDGQQWVMSAAASPHFPPPHLGSAAFTFSLQPSLQAPNDPVLPAWPERSLFSLGIYAPSCQWMSESRRWCESADRTHWACAEQHQTPSKLRLTWHLPLDPQIRLFFYAQIKKVHHVSSTHWELRRLLVRSATF